MDITVSEFVITVIVIALGGFFLGVALMINTQSRDRQKELAESAAKRAAEAEAKRQEDHTQAVKEHTAELRKANAHAKLKGLSPVSDSVTEWSV